MRELSRVIALLLLLGCAQASTPPGGPPDEEPPKLVRLRPDTNSVNVAVRAAGFDFDEVISERPQGAVTLDGLFLISPGEGSPNVSWRRTRLEVRPRGGFRRNTTYSITMLPGLTDLDGNVDSLGATIVFSTGATLASSQIAGRVFDWMADRAAPLAYVEALSLPDSSRYLTYADSTGQFVIEHLPPGRFLLRAIVDPNRNRALDPRELHDTATVSLSDSLRLNLHAIVRDTLGPGMEAPEIIDSVTLRVRFDRAIDTSLVIAPALVTLKQADSTVIPILSASGGRLWQKARDDSAFLKATQDSIRAAAVADSAARADSIAGRPKPPPRPSTPLRPAPQPAARPAPGDSVLPPPRPSVRIPERDIVLKLGRPLAPGTAFRVRATGVRSIVGRVRSSERQFSTPRARPSTDSTARRDTSAVQRAH